MKALDNEISKIDDSKPKPPPPYSPPPQLPPPTHYLEENTKAKCTESCNNSINYNSQYNCGIPNPIIGLMAQEPGMAQCSINLKQEQNACLSRCNKLKY